MGRLAILLIAGLILSGCFGKPTPPAGRWIGNFESPSVMVDAWLEIMPDGTVRICAPDILDVGSPSDEDRASMHARLASDLSDAWGEVQLRLYDFDGTTFRKPGGVAPQMEWNPTTHRMKLVFYFGTQRSIRIDMRPVKDFSDDPWVPAPQNS